MKPTAQLHEVRRMRFLDVWGRFDRKELTVEQAIDLLSVSRSTFYRMRCRYASEGEEGLIDHRVGKASPRQIPVDRQMDQLCASSSAISVRRLHGIWIERQGASREWALGKLVGGWPLAAPLDN